MATSTLLPSTVFVRIPKKVYAYKFKNKHPIYEGFDSYSTTKVYIPSAEQSVVNQIKTTIVKSKKNKKLPTVLLPRNCIELENKGFSNIRFVGVRQPYLNGSTLYVELVDQKLIVPVTNSFISYCIRYNLLKDDCFIGEYRFVKMGTKDVELVHIDSPIYQTALEIEEKFKTKKLQTKKFEFEVGCCYENPSGNVGMFLGYMSTAYMKPVLQGKDRNHILTKQTDSALINQVYNSTLFASAFNNSNVFAMDMKEHDIMGVPYPFKLDYRVDVQIKDYLGLWLNLGNKHALMFQNVVNMNQQEFDGFISNHASYLKTYQITYSSFELKKRSTYIKKVDTIKKFEIDYNLIRDMKNYAKEGLNGVLKRDCFEEVSYFSFVMCSAYAPFINMNYLGFTKTIDPYFDHLEKYIQI